MSSHRLRSYGIALLGLAALLAPRRAAAQLAPTGSHYGARPSDTGFEPGGANALGGYSTSIPLDLPPARGNLPIPFSVVYGAHGSSAAGAGWDIPLSFVQDDTSFNHRRPGLHEDVAPRGRERLSVVLPGRGRIEMVVKSAGIWVGRADGADLTMQFHGEDASWTVSDGAGRTYTFRTPVGKSGMFLLDSVTGAGGGAVALKYLVADLSPTGSTNVAASIDLQAVRYDPHPTTADCYKYEIDLSYDPAPLTVHVVGDTVLERMDMLRKIDVTSRPSCTATPVSLRHYMLAYQVDPDTHLSQLLSVKLWGRQGTTEANTVIPIATYTYGTATYNDGLGGFPAMRYETAAQPVALPSSAPYVSATVTLPPLFQLPDASSVVGTWQSLTDVTGDGRADFIFMGSNNQPYIARNVAGPNGTSLFGAATPLFNGPLTAGFFEERGSKYPRFQTPQTTGANNIDYEWRKAIDFNGDGRIDIVDAAEKPGHWTVYLNTPDPGGQGITWVRHSVKIDELYQRMSVERHLDLHDGYLPLSRRFTSNSYYEWACWYLDSNGEVAEDTSPFPNRCGYPSGTLPTGSESTYVEWELKDVNGDGYPDMVMNSSPTQITPEKQPDKTQLLANGYWLEARRFSAAPIGDPNPDPTKAGAPNRVDVALNVRGIFLSTDPSDANQFAAPVTYVQSAYCGVSSWSDRKDQGLFDVQSSRCDITDVNGDGIADRVVAGYLPNDDKVSTLVTLGTGSGFQPVQLALPDHQPLSEQRSQQPAMCAGASGSTTFVSRTATALRDITGDGIPDLVHYDVTTSQWVVWIGTGAGFFATASPIQVQGAAFGLSENVESCDGSLSYTSGGLFDIDGDGKPEVVWRSGNSLTVSQLVGNSTPGTPEAGRLVGVDNGYGAITRITYRSAKDDPHLLHQVPFPEIVATSVETDSAVDGRVLGASRYAYAGAVMMYDQALDGYRLPAYGRTVELHAVIDAVDRPNAQATISDTYPVPTYATFDATANEAERFGRYLRAGRVSDVTVLGVVGASDPWPLLDVNIYSDTRRMAGAHYAYLGSVVNQLDSDVLQVEDADDFCQDVIDPYDWDKTGLGWTNGFDPCSAHGFLYTQLADSWRGTGPQAQTGVEQQVSVLAVDEFARPRTILYSNDVHRSDDDYCVDTTFATPAGVGAPVLTAVSSRKVYDCSKGSTNAVYGFETFDYDKLPHDSVGAGHVTGHNVERHATDTGAVLANFRDFDVTYNAAGVPTQIVRTREDGSKRTTSVSYDAFDVAPTRVIVAGTGTATLTTYYSRDAYTLDVTETRDANNAMRGTHYDGFGRPTMTTFRMFGGTQMALSSVSYLGFSDTSGRRVAVKQFTDPVATNTVATAPARVSTTYFDELGRDEVTNVALGADYGNETLIVGARTYDSLGRVVFEADPYPASQDPNTAYGTTRYFSVDGTPNVFLRGRGRQPLTTTPDPSVERFPTVYRHSFAGYQESMSVQQPDSLTSGSPQNGVIRAEIKSAIGRVLFRSTWQNGTRLEHEQLTTDRVGHRVALVRFGDPVNAALPVQTITSYDSLGNMVQLLEPAGAVQNRTFSNFGELKEIDFIPGGTQPMHSVIRKFDALGRLVHAEEQNGGVTDADTVYDYKYDAPVSPTTLVTPTNVIGRLAAATAPTGGQYFSYDNYGNVNARAFTDESAAYYIERDSFHGDGSRASLELDLPDNAYTPEHVDYGYDSAGRVRSMLYSDGTSSQSLYAASTVDAFGRVRKASFGESTYAADYADTGRRLFKDVTVSSPLGLRSIVINSYDAVGRELSRTQQGKTNDTQVSTYDALGRLATSVTANGPSILANWSYGYDALGNINGLNDYVGSKDAAISYGTTDRDQICRINYNAFGTACNVSHDGFGNVVYEGTRTGARKISYYNSGSARRIDDSAGSSVTMKYDPLGREQELDLAAGGETRSDRQYGAYIYKRYQLAGLLKANYIGRRFSAPGVLVSRRGVGGSWVISFPEARGVRFSTDEKGTFVQDVDYEPFGEATVSGAAPGSPTYSTEQWNSGDALGAVGLVQVGARLYDPVIGRFLSRDPLFAPRTAATANPYAFADNNPVGHSDPTGLCSDGDEGCVPVLPPIFGGSGGGGGGGGSGSGSGGGLPSGDIPTTLVSQPHQDLPQPLPISSDDNHDTGWTVLDWFDKGLTVVGDERILKSVSEYKWLAEIAGMYTSTALVAHSAYENLYENWDGGWGGVRFGADLGSAGWALASGATAVGWTVGAKYGAIGLGHAVRYIEDANEEGEYGSLPYRIKQEEQEYEQHWQSVVRQRQYETEVRVEARLEPLIEKVDNAEWDGKLQSLPPSCSGPNPSLEGGSLTDVLRFQGVAP